MPITSPETELSYYLLDLRGLNLHRRLRAQSYFGAPVFRLGSGRSRGGGGGGGGGEGYRVHNPLPAMKILIFSAKGPLKGAGNFHLRTAHTQFLCQLDSW